MRKKITILIAVSILGLIALSIIQGYLINNTYKLEKNVFISETRKSISRLDDLSPSLDEINDVWQDDFLNLIADYYVKSITEEEVLEKLQQKTDSLNNSYIKHYKDEVEKKNIEYDLKFKKVVKLVIVLDSVRNDTIFKADKRKENFHLLGERFSDEDSHRVSSSMWLTDHTFDREVDGAMRSVTYNLQFQTEDRMNIDGWKKIVLRRMTGLLVTSILIFLLVFSLLYYSIKNLISQKKIADIKTDFANNITHELKTPLATLTLATKLLKNHKSIATSKDAETIITTIERQNKRLQNLIDQVLNNSLGYTQIQLNKEKVSSNEYLNTLLDDFALSVTAKNVEIKRNLKNGGTISIDKFFFTTALLNLLENAVKYTEENAKIEILSSKKDSFVISIKDNGIGISSRDQKLVFDKFFRAGNREIHNVKGLGLGLYYANQIIKAHKGKIDVRSVKGEGTTFTVEIPLV